MLHADVTFRVSRKLNKRNRRGILFTTYYLEMESFPARVYRAIANAGILHFASVLQAYKGFEASRGEEPRNCASQIKKKERERGALSTLGIPYTLPVRNTGRDAEIKRSLTQPLSRHARERTWRKKHGGRKLFDIGQLPLVCFITRRKVSRWWNNRVEYGEGREVGGRRRCRDAAVRRHIATAPSDWITR